jgi:hypothetical protein
MLSAQKHNEREKEAYKSNPDIDLERSKDNIHLKPPAQKSYRRIVKERIAESECKTVIKKNSVLLVETLITGSPDLIQPMSHDEMLAYMKRAYDFMAKRVGEQNIVSAVIHLDEKTPHMHLCFVPLSEDNRLTAKEIIGNQARLSEFWQDGFYEHMHEKCEVIERGESAKITHRKHIPVWLYKKAEHLDKMYSEVETILSNIGMFNAKGKSEEALTVLREWAKEGEYFSSKVKETTKHIEGLEKEVESLSASHVAKKNFSHNVILRLYISFEYCFEFYSGFYKPIVYRYVVGIVGKLFFVNNFRCQLIIQTLPFKLQTKFVFD